MTKFTAAEPTGTNQRTHPIISLLAILTLCYAVAFVGVQGAMIGLQFWYLTIPKPSWTPPPWLFGPVWTVLYAMMGFAAWMVWRSERDRRLPLALFAIQLVLNGLWSWIFFAWQRLDIAFYEVIALWLAIALTVWAFWRVRPTAGALLVPYLLWVAFAGALNLAIWKLSR